MRTIKKKIEPPTSPVLAARKISLLKGQVWRKDNEFAFLHIKIEKSVEDLN